MQRQAGHVAAVEAEQVEHVHRQRAAAVLEQREPRPAVLVERAHLAVEHAVGASQRTRERPRDLANRPLRSLPFRLRSVASPPSTVAITR